MKRGFTMLEVAIGAAIMLVIVGVLGAGLSLMNRQSRRAFDALSQMQDALLLMETIRMELSAIVMNPQADQRNHRGNSFLISVPNGTSIQFVTERREGGSRQRYLVYYEAKTTPGPKPASALTLTKKVWKFTRQSGWTDMIQFPPGWPTEWIGPEVETNTARYQNLGVQDMRWHYLVPATDEGRVFFRIKLVLKSEGGRMLPFSTLVTVPTPDHAQDASECPCLNAPCYDPKLANCDCCNAGGGPK